MKNDQCARQMHIEASNSGFLTVKIHGEDRKIIDLRTLCDPIKEVCEHRPLHAACRAPKCVDVKDDQPLSSLGVCERLRRERYRLGGLCRRRKQGGDNESANEERFSEDQASPWTLIDITAGPSKGLLANAMQYARGQVANIDVGQWAPKRA